MSETQKEPTPEKSELEILKEDFEEKNKAIEELKNKYLRALADLDNFKKRAAIDRENFIRFANESIISEILPVLDGFDRAMQIFEKSSAEETVKGIALIKRQLLDILKKSGVREVESVGKIFDPNFHEAIMKKESEKPENTIIEEAQKGYILNGKLIRPAMVIVAAKNDL